MNRKEIEDKWLQYSESNSMIGLTSLCPFTIGIGDPLKFEWFLIWDTQDLYDINRYFSGDGDWHDLAYLTRALSLNMLLDDNGIK